MKVILEGISVINPIPYKTRGRSDDYQSADQ